jgi:hypothetical protein
MRVMASAFVQPVPRVQVRDIKLKDGTSILSPEFLARENAWYLERFGKMEVAYVMQVPRYGGRGFDEVFAMNPRQFAMLKDIS